MLNQLNNFNKLCRVLGHLEIKPLDVDNQSGLLHSWVTQEYASFWGMSKDNESKVKTFYRELENSGHARAYLGYSDAQPAFLIELYLPEHDPVGKTYDTAEGDIGMHFLVAPCERRIPGFSLSVIQAIAEFIFTCSQVKRIVVEPDVTNAKVHLLNRNIGFIHTKQVKIGEKNAFLGFCTRDAFAKAIDLREKMAAKPDISPQSIVNIAPSVWEVVHRKIVAKAIGECIHERLLTAEVIEKNNNTFRVMDDTKTIEYQFAAKTYSLEHWIVEAATLIKIEKGETKPINAINWFLEFSEQLNMGDDVLPTYLEEITSTLNSLAFKYQFKKHKADEMFNASFQAIESLMIEGHPAFVANSGRIGFSEMDYWRYAPESAQPINIGWIAVHHSVAKFTSSKAISYEALMEQELDLSTRTVFEKTLLNAGVNTDDYFWMPVHPWQWSNKITRVYSDDILNKRIIWLGYSDDVYQPQQSIRTFYNLSNGNKFYVKMALSILNMGFMRGLSAAYMAKTPQINDWVYEFIEKDSEFAQYGFKALREIASAGFHNLHYEHEKVGNTGHRKMLAALWRESPTSDLTDNQKLVTMASLLHRDNDDNAFLPVIIEASGLTASEWLQRYLQAYLTPLLHCFYQYQVVFMPHGENLIIKLDSGIPVGAYMKDIGEEVIVFGNGEHIPEEIKRIHVELPDDIAVLSIFTDVFDGFFRFLAPIFEDTTNVTTQQFWKQVAETILQYQVQHPELAESFKRYDLFVDDFLHSCLNRLQFANNKQMVDLTDPAAALQFIGKLKNPVAPFKTFDLELSYSKQNKENFKSEVVTTS